MDVLEAIFSRRSEPKVSDERPTRDEISHLLEAAVRAPNHFLTEPWRFIVLTGSALDELGDAMAARVRRELAGSPDLEDKVRFERARPRRAPVIVTMVYVPAKSPKAVDAEDRYAIGAAMQNMLLAAHAAGMAGYVRTGPAAVDPDVHRHLGLEEGEEIAGFVYLGYPSEQPSEGRRRTPAAENTMWKGWD